MKKPQNQAGFTIIELLIATLVFSVILIICLEGVTRIGKLYYKGVSLSQTQELIRNLSSDFTQQIQFGGKETQAVTSGTGGTALIFCVGDYRYRAVMNRPIGDAGVDSILKRKPYTGQCEHDESVEPFDGAVELGSKGMRIQRINVISNATGLWTVDIKVALGQDDLLEFPSGSTDDPAVYGEVNCKTGLAGSEFCATAELETTVLRRIR